MNVSPGRDGPIKRVRVVCRFNSTGNHFLAVLRSHGYWAEPRDALTSRLHVRRISLSNFRNYSQCTFRLDERCVVLTGRNGSGKTNILEGIYLLGHLKSFRGSPGSEIIRRHMPAGRLLAEVMRDNVLTTIELTFQGQQKSARINGKPVSKSSELLGLFQLFYFLRKRLV